MGYVKVVKNRNYFKRFKVKWRRRRECKTDYSLRRRLITQDKRKYNAPKWRFIVRITNADIVCQVASSKMNGDQILCAAYAHELKRFGLQVGLTNYAAAYCTGLLLARRLLKKLKLDKFYPGKKKLDGNKFLSHVANVRWKDCDGDKIYRPFKCLLDIGLARSSTGARVFGALKGAVDGGLDIPHSQKRFPGFVKGTGKKAKDSYNAQVHCDKIFGEHVCDYMRKLQEDNPEKYSRHFSRYIAQGLTADNLADKYADVHKKIRSNPSAAPKRKRDVSKMKLFPELPKKLAVEVRNANRKAKIEVYKQKAQDKLDAKQQNNMQVDVDDTEAN